jgi:dephospho-CoA kinase
MKTIGITGGIGSGKSVVSQLLKVWEIPVYDSDREAKRITGSSGVIREKLSAKFGPGLYQTGELNKEMLASLIFSKPDYLAFVNSVIHPEVFKDFFDWKEKQLGKAFVGIESAILFESHFDKSVDISITIAAPLETRIRRVQQREKINRESVLNRIKNQMSEEERNCLADYVIVNDDIQGLIPQIENLFEALKSQ